MIVILLQQLVEVSPSAHTHAKDAHRSRHSHCQ